MKRSHLAALLDRTERNQLISSIGLLVIYGAAWVALTGGLVTPLGMVAACLPALLAGVLIARGRGWPIMALTAVVGNLGCLATGGGEGVSGDLLFAGLLLTLVVSAFASVRTRWLWPNTIATFGALGLLNLWRTSAVIQPGLLLVGLAAAWLLGMWTGTSQKVAGRAKVSSWLAIASTAVATTSVIAACGFSAQLAALAGALMVLQGLVHDRIPGEADSTGKLLCLAGIGMGAIATWMWLGILGLAVGLGALSMLLVHVGKGRRDPRWMVIAGAAIGGQAITLLIGHPAFTETASTMWHLWSLVALGVCVQLFWIARKGPPIGQKAATFAWLPEALASLQAIAAVAAVSTELGLLSRWLPTLTLFWTGSAALLWLFGNQKLRFAAALVLAAAVFKLLVFDWLAVGVVARVSLLLSVGATMFVTPLLGSFEIARGKVSANREVESC